MQRPPPRKRKGDQTRSGTSLLDVYSTYIQGLRPGNEGNYSGYCPLHGETPGKSTPSLSVNIETGLWYCFAGCGGGTISSFLEAIGEDRSEIDRTMNQIGPLLTRHVKKTGPATESEGVILPEKLLGVFDECPRELVEAGFDWRVLQEHDVGYDKRLNRITFPIRTMTGELAGIVGRCRDPDFGGKYKVYTTELRTFGFNIETFKKSNFLWRGDKVLSVLSESTGRPDIFVVEGFKAALWFAQSGIDTVVALMGSSMSNRQQQHIERFGGRVILCLDNDPAGKKATRKISHQLRAVRTLVVPLPEGIHQPDDLTGEELVEFCSSPTSLREAINQWTE